eukprot:CAMPEP_0176495698 /NCGR_PEP_ID=MMETSP0200_2-20121128/10802_1 /TAXON_ID=947934 /ORGANISM="Chaetoceros sp., Strain GSL56" /LENGTH=1451 /DNA_ID=CAMNT_0017893607 /DNA_START=672 /DNA_END=5027 /DNA_ORIENTATION=-
MTSIGGSTASYGVNKSFVFDKAFSPETKQNQIFQQCIEPLVGACLSGYNATVLAYGQTGSGKTFTILGPSTEGIFAQDDGVSARASQAGVIPRALRDLFSKLEGIKKRQQGYGRGTLEDMADTMEDASCSSGSDRPYQYEVRIQFLELYGEEIRDLLNVSGNKLVIRDGGGGVEPEVIGASEVKVNSAEEALLCLMRGTLRRVTGATAMNSESSRSHAIMSVIVEQTTVLRPGSAGSVVSAGSDSIGNDGIVTRSSSTTTSGNTDIETKRSKFHFVDLAGSERQKRSLAQGQRLKEGIDINKGLLVLGNVISALGDPKKQGKVFVPYRDSKLTRLLKGSLGGNHKTLMIACVSPSSINMEESLNCLRYANRAKNIQNNAVINLDAGSKLVAELRLQIQALARELLEYQEKTGDDSSKVFKLSFLRSLANGVDSSNMNLGTPNNNGIMKSHPNSSFNIEKAEVDEEIIMRFKAEIERLKSVTKQLEQDLAYQSEELFAARAESEYYRLMRQEGGSDYQISAEGSDKATFVNRVKEYEKEVARLKNQLQDIRAAQSIPSSPSPWKVNSNLDDSPPTPKSSRNKSTIRVSVPLPTIDKDDEEDKEMKKITQKYLKVGQHEVGVNDDENDEDEVDHKTVSGGFDEEDEEYTFTSRQSIISSHVVQLTRGIAAKEELITKLEESQLKYERMKSFYQEKLRKMTLQLTIQEAEKATLEVELKKSAKDSQKYKELEEQLFAKQKHINELKKRQKEVKNLTSIASRNETIISKLSSEIESMKKQKSALEQQLVKERKEHTRSLQQLKKKAQSQEKDVIMMRQQLAATIAQKEKVQDIAKSRAKEILELRSKYNTAEKKLRMQTLKRGMMERVGIDPILVGRNQIQKSRPSSRLQNNSFEDVQKVRTFLEEKIADIGRKEATAEKLAQEWEDQLELTSRKEQIIAQSKGKLKDSGLKDEIEALDFQIEYKESRIRSLAAKLATKAPDLDEKDNKGPPKDVLLDDGIFKNITSGLNPLAASQLASKVLFGMVVREKRRVATLARAASTLDQKAVNAERLLTEKEAALRSLIEESKNERLAMAQSHQDRILSLMEIVQGEDEGESMGGNLSPTRSNQHSDSLILRMANERIEALESELTDLRREKESRDNLAEKEAEKMAELTEVTKDYSSLIEKSKFMRQTLVKIRDSINISNNTPESSSFVKIKAVIDKTLKSLDDQPTDSSKKPPLRTDLTSPFEDLDSDIENDSEVPDWADHILKDLAIIAAGDVPPSLKVGGQSSSTPRGLPRTPRGNTYDRVSAYNYERFSDSESVWSNSNSSRNRDRSQSTNNRPRYQSPHSTTGSRSSSTPRRSYRSPSPMRQRSPLHSETRLTDRISAILKDGPPRVLTLPDTSDFADDKSVQSFRSTGSRSTPRSRQRSIPPGESTFVKAYTKKDVFERLQKKHTNSYTLNLQASQSFERNS